MRAKTVCYFGTGRTNPKYRPRVLNISERPDLYAPRPILRRPKKLFFSLHTPMSLKTDYARGYNGYFAIKVPLLGPREVPICVSVLS